MSCYYCTICNKPTQSIRHHAHYCHVFNGTSVVPNREYIPTKHFEIEGCDAPYYCTRCKSGVGKGYCLVHKMRTFIRHMGVYISQTTHVQLTTHMLLISDAQNKAVEMCKEFVSCSARTVYSYGKQENHLGICCVCSVITDKPRHCRMLTKIYHDGCLEPDPLKFPAEPLRRNRIGEYYCSRCGCGADLSTCKKCKKTSTHRWLSITAGCGYIARAVHNDYTYVHILDGYQKDQIIANLHRLIIDNNAIVGMVQI